MSDLIDRQAAIDAIDSIWGNIEAIMREHETEITKALHVEQSVKAVIKQVPSARKPGKWIRHNEVKNVYGGICIECSECGEKYVVRYVEDEKYCRNCGADNRGEEE